MSVAKFMVATAVPFNMARLQHNTNRNIIRKTTEVGLKQTADCDDLQNQPRKRQRLLDLAPKEKLQLRKQRNRESSFVSRQKAKLYEDLLNKQLLDLQIQKMKLLMENEALKKQGSRLEAENHLLKEKLNNNIPSQDERNCSLVGTFEHAWFVYISLLKKWVLPQALIILLMTVKEIFRTSVPAQSLWKAVLLGIPRSFNNLVKFLMNLSCQMWKMNFCPVNYPRNLILLNG